MKNLKITHKILLSLILSNLLLALTLTLSTYVSIKKQGIKRLKYFVSKVQILSSKSWFIW